MRMQACGVAVWGQNLANVGDQQTGHQKVQSKDSSYEACQKGFMYHPFVERKEYHLYTHTLSPTVPNPSPMLSAILLDIFCEKAKLS